MSKRWMVLQKEHTAVEVEEAGEAMEAAGGGETSRVKETAKETVLCVCVCVCLCE
jgi:hypothetical protein